MATESEKILFFDRYKDWAILTQALSGVPASITLSQGAIESGWGTSRLARQGNNFFGIKDHSFDSWFGDYILASDDKPNEKFRKYKSPYDSFIDHANFLVDNRRYNPCFDTTDYRKWAECLQTAGYATDKNYASNLISIIEQYDLEKYDKEGDVQMETLPNTLIRNRRTVYAITGVIILLLIALFFVGRKLFK